MPNCINNVTSAVIDSESVAWDPATKQILPFQVLTTRKRKDAVASEIKVQVCIHAFDLLYLNGESLVKKSLRERRELLHTHFKSIEGEFVFATARDMSEIDELQVFLDQAVKDSTEGKCLTIFYLLTYSCWESGKFVINFNSARNSYAMRN